MEPAMRIVIYVALGVVLLLEATPTLACQPCRERTTDRTFLEQASVVVHVRGLPGKRPNARPWIASFGDYRARVLDVLKGKVDQKEIRVHWSYGECLYQGPDLQKGQEAILFLGPDGKGGFYPTSTGCGNVMLSVKNGKTSVDGEWVTIAELKKRLLEKPQDPES
jgi:hypothetical protein